MQRLVQGHPVASYFVLAFVISWAGVLLLSGALGYSDATKGLVFVAQVLGPPLAAIITAAIVGGSGEIGAIFAGMRVWRAPFHCYAIALLAVPLTAIAVLLACSAFSTAFLPGVLTASSPLALIALGVVGGLVAGGIEEVGWTGFAIRKAPRGWSVLTTGVIFGVLHGIWHFPAGYLGESARYGVLFIPYFVVFWIAALAALRVLIVWLYRRTGSLPLAQLTHASFTGSLLFLWPNAANTGPANDTAWTTIFAAVLWVVVLTIQQVADRPGLKNGST